MKNKAVRLCGWLYLFTSGGIQDSLFGLQVTGYKSCSVIGKLVILRQAQGGRRQERPVLILFETCFLGI
jgi:hypothetical protein